MGYYTNTCSCSLEGEDWDEGVYPTQARIAVFAPLSLWA